MKVVFRVDASLNMGTGHVMRCLTLAQVLKDNGANVEFICRKHEGNLIDKVRASEFIIHELEVFEETEVDDKLAHSCWLGATQQQDADDCIDILKAEKFNWLIVDHYALDSQWQKRLKPYYEKLMVIDDLADRKHNCNILLDQNLVSNMNCRYDDLVENSCQKLLGPKFALLQSAYSKLHKYAKVRTKVKRIIISFGGNDINNLTEFFIEAFINLNSSDISTDVVISKSSVNFKKIQEMVKNHTNIDLHSDLPSLAELMIKSDLAIGASGSTTWERLCLRLPSIVATLAYNQEETAAELHSRRLIYLIGSSKEVTVKNAEHAMRHFINHNKENEQMAKMYKKIDGRGVERVSKFILEYKE